ncbi:MAG: signal peptidase II [Pseudomonadota bacterium]
MRSGAPLILTLVTVAVLLLDRGTKLYVVEWLGLINGGGPIDVIPPYLRLVMGWNTGINFGLFESAGAGQRWFLIGLAVAVSAGLSAWALRSGGRHIPAACGFVIGGALGNAWDRITYGAVADFLNVSCCGIDNPFVFNVADAAIFVGAVWLILMPGQRREA